MNPSDDGQLLQFNIKKPNPRNVLIISLTLTLLLGVTDYLIGSEISFSIFYLLPISLSVLLANFKIGAISSIISAFVWLTADLLAKNEYSHFLIPYWNATMRFGYFFIHTVMISKLLELIQKEKNVSFYDPLTSAANWRYFEIYATQEIKKSKRLNKPFTLVFFDLDDFKKVNDELGHDTGDELLRTLAETIQSQLRANDLLARLGGDEFAFILPESSYQEAEITIKRVRESVLNEMHDRRWPVTLSVGAITFKVISSNIVNMLKKVDKLMYSVKNGGKNNIKHELWPPDSET